jgi:hypothetical protein
VVGQEVEGGTIERREEENRPLADESTVRVRYIELDPLSLQESIYLWSKSIVSSFIHYYPFTYQCYVSNGRLYIY